MSNLSDNFVSTTNGFPVYVSVTPPATPTTSNSETT